MENRSCANIKINTQDFCIDDFFIINNKIHVMSELQTFRVEMVFNMSCFNIMKRKSLRTSQWKQSNTDKL